MKPTPFSVIFDNGGGITIQHPTYVHHYSYPEQAAIDAFYLLNNADPGDWEGYEPECRMEYDQQTVDNGGYRWFYHDDIQEYIKAKELPDMCQGWVNIEEFFDKLRTLI